MLGDAATGALAKDAVVVLKRFWRDTPPDRIGLLASFRERRFGETALTFYRRETVAPPARARRTTGRGGAAATSETTESPGARER